MDPKIYAWTKAVHVIGFLLWTGGLWSCVQLLRVHSGAPGEARQALSSIERKTAMFMDMGALLAIAAGLYLALGVTPSAFKTGGWLHLKLTVVVLGLLSLHGYIRVKIRKFRNGQIMALPSFVHPVTLAVIALIAVIAVVKPFAK